MLFFLRMLAGTQVFFFDLLTHQIEWNKFYVHSIITYISTFASLRMNILCIKLKAITQNYLQHHYLSSYLWGSIFTHTWKTLTSLHCFTKGEVWIHNICLTLPLFIEVSVQSQKSERSYKYICNKSVKFSCVFTISNWTIRI
jgi:hypothetical protein